MRVSTAETFGVVTLSPEFADESTERWPVSEELSEIARETRDNARKLMIASAKQVAIWRWRDWGEGVEDSALVSIQTRGHEGGRRVPAWLRNIQKLVGWMGWVGVSLFVLGRFHLAGMGGIELSS